MKKIIIDMPKKLLKAANSVEAKDKPYNICLECPALGGTCDGPNCLAMLYDRWVEWINTLAKQKGLTRAMIAEEANLSLATVNSVLSGKGQDVKLYTAAAITKAVKGGSWGKYPCNFVATLMNAEFVETDDIDTLEHKLNLARQEIEMLKSVDTSEEIKQDAQKKIDFLKDQIAFKERDILESRATIKGRDRAIKVLGVITGILAATFIALFIADALLPNTGWFVY